jgi:hypothetical protein
MLLRERGFSSDKIVSLLDMLAYGAEIFCIMSEVAGKVSALPIGLLRAYMQNDNLRQQILLTLESAKREAQNHKWNETVARIAELEDYLTGPINAGVLQSKFTDLQQHVLRVFADNLFFRIDRDDIGEWDHWREEMAVWQSKFPSAWLDLSYAIDCYLFDKADASVFHAMRALENGLKALADTLHVQISQRDQWETIINNLEAAIKQINGPHAGSDWKKKQEQYAGAALHFRFLKTAWRNHVMHARARYDQKKAKEILGHVIAFIRELTLDIGLSEPFANVLGRKGKKRRVKTNSI